MKKKKTKTKQNKKVNKEVSPPKSKEHGSVKVGLKSWKVGCHKLNRWSLKSNGTDKKRKKAKKWVTAQHEIRNCGGKTDENCSMI